MRALILDADARAALAISLMLQAAKISVDRSGLAKHALELTRRYSYDILLLDLVLPDLSGCQLIRRMRSACLRRPMLVLSRVSQPHARAAALDAGADGFLAKPFGQSELLARVRRLLPQARPQEREGLPHGGGSGVLVPLAPTAWDWRSGRAAALSGALEQSAGLPHAAGS